MMATALSMPRDVRSRGWVRCDWCSRQIDAGETYRAAAFTLDGRAYTWHECTHCRALVTSTTLYDYLWSLAGDDAGWSPEDIAEWEPAGRREAALKSRWLRGWRSWNGDVRSSDRWRPADTNPLLPVPLAPPHAMR